MKEMYGQITAEFHREGLEDMCRAHMSGYDPERFSVVAIRLYCAREVIVTIYAEDKLSQLSTLPENKFPVRKFKKELRHPSEILDFMQAFNFTVANPDYVIDEMEIVNR